MSLQYFSVVVFLAALACLPWLVRWLKARVPSTARGGAPASRVVSAVAVGPHQRVVTVEVGPAHDRVWLTLGVTAQNIACLHTCEAPSPWSDLEGAPTVPSRVG
ncbi:MAG: flagellar biosynthetic protein FliO [Rhodoferax sp.]|nr:flagellar biosynthetic protein FliO [Rhodoferax sp.]